MTLQTELANEREKAFAISGDMTNQYKQMQQQLLREIDTLKQSVASQEVQMQQKDTETKELVKQHEAVLFRKDEEIKELRKKADEMSVEFARMLKQLLGKMNEKIEVSQWQAYDIKAVGASGL